ncbi:MAG: xanthine dehydrogenase family protein molybdopterin-binding subunit [Neomegalonema sp.]|nr:xanthine dehydrogenase family protein molybdopterin-binding subunit [Neomegalonema sp.]
MNETAPIQKFGIGARMARLEDDRLLRGQGRYVDDLTLPDQLIAYVFRSPFAHGRIRALDVNAAREAPGVVSVLTHDEAAFLGLKPLTDRSGLKNADGSPIAPVMTPQLAVDAVRFVGQPVALIVAHTREQARDAAELIELDVEEAPVVIGARAALEPGAPELHALAPGNLSYDWEIGDAAAVAGAFEAAAHVTRLPVQVQRIVANAMEPRAILARYDGESERWEIHTVSQGVHGMRGQLAQQLGVAPDRLRVMTPDVGGGFGMKLMVHPEYALIAAAAKDLGRAIKWTADRSESFLSDAQAREMDVIVEGAFDEGGKVLAIRADVVSNLGAYYSQFGASIHAPFSAGLLGSIYRVPMMHSRVRGAFSNTVPTDAYRGAGRPEINYVTERLFDQAAHELGLDAAEIRRRNLLTAADMPYSTMGGLHFDSGDCVAHLEMALEKAGYGEREARRAAALEEGKAYGMGVCYYMERTGGGPAESTRVQIQPAGRAQIAIGTQSNGQGHHTAWAQILHEKLGIDPSTVQLAEGDSDALAVGGGTGGSRSLIMAHRVLYLAADQIIEKGKDIAARKLEADVADIEFSPREGGQFRIAGTDRAMDLFAAAAAAQEVLGEEALTGEGAISERTATYPNGAHVVEVAVDLETGALEILRYVIVDDFGNILNPLLVEGQVHGGIAQGIGQALMEAAVLDPQTGQPLSGSYMDYAMPRAADMPMFDLTLSQAAPCQTNPMGVKGCGEAGSVGATPAVVLAALDALRPHGVEDLQTPLTPLRLWTALREGKIPEQG